MKFNEQIDTDADKVNRRYDNENGRWYGVLEMVIEREHLIADGWLEEVLVIGR